MPKSKKTVIAFVGPIASGKGSAVKYLEKKYKASTYRFSTMLRDVLKRLYIEQNRKNLVKLSIVLRRNFGQDTLSKTMAEDISRDKNKLIIIDGARRISDLNHLKKLPNFHLIKVDADSKIRWQRLKKRGENIDDRTKTFNRFKKDEKSEIEKSSRHLAKFANHTIDNSQGRKYLHSQLDDLIKKVTP